MAKVYLLTENDFQALMDSLLKDPKRGGSGRELTLEERQIYNDAYRFYNYQVCTWLDAVKK